MNKTLLVLAASKYQIPTIESGKRLGYKVITTDNISSNTGHSLANKSFNIDTTDVEAICDLAAREDISGVISSGTDIAVITAAIVAEKLGLIGPPVAAAQILTNKLTFRQFLRENNFSCPMFYSVDSYFEISEVIFEGCTWVVKPCRSSGSKGIFIVNNKKNFEICVSESQYFSIDGNAILEEYIDGTQHTCEGVLLNGKVQIHLITDRDTALPPFVVTVGHRVPSSLPMHLQLQAISEIENVLSRLNVLSGPFNCDFVATKDSIVLLEITPRLGGNSLSDLFKLALNFDLVDYAVTHACGDPRALPQLSPPMPCAIIILGTECEGLLKWNKSEAESLKNEIWVQKLIFDYEMGTPVKQFINGRNRVGEVLLTGSDRTDLDSKLTEFKNRLGLCVD